MKTLINIGTIIVLAIFLGACSGSYKAGVTEYDDLYYTPRDARMQAQVTETDALAATTQTRVQDPQEELSDYEKYRLSLEGENQVGETVPEAYAHVQEDTAYYGPEGDYGYAYYDEGTQPPVVNNYYGTVNQYPSYSSRIQRFHSPYIGYRYYDPWYYDSWYDPWYYDSWYYPGYWPRFSVNMGFGWGYSGWGYPYYSWGYPYWGYGSYYRSFWRGYNLGWYDSYYYGGGYYYPNTYGNYSESHNRTGYTYGHRSSRSGLSTYGARTTDPKRQLRGPMGEPGG